MPPSAPAPPPPTAKVEIEVTEARDAFSRAAEALGCSSRVPTSFIGRNMSVALAASVHWNVTVLPLAGEGVSNDAQALTTVPSAVGINVTIYNDPDLAPRDCSRYAYVPFVYLVTVPLWGLLTAWWMRNTYYVNAPHARDLHRLMCWVPIMETVHGILSIFNYVAGSQ